jgi:hypothetical protein
VRLHACFLSRDCRRFGVVWRVHLDTPWGHFGMALVPGSGFVDRHDPPGEKVCTTWWHWQAWLNRERPEGDSG